MRRDDVDVVAIGQAGSLTGAGGVFAFRCPTMELVVRPTRLQTREGGNWVVDAPIPMFQLNARN